MIRWELMMYGLRANIKSVFKDNSDFDKLLNEVKEKNKSKTIMVKLTIEHLAPYLPYEIKYYSMETHEKQEYDAKATKPTEFELLGLDNFWVHSACDYSSLISDTFPILRPLSDLIKEIEVNSEKFTPINYLYSMNSSKLNWDDVYMVERVTNALNRDVINKKLSYYFMQKLFQWHFDVFGLITKGLAIDINTL